MTQITRNFALGEFIESGTATRYGIDNSPGPAALDNIVTILAPGMQRVRDLLGHPMFITSGYRCPEVNSRVGSSSRSQHLLGLAADFTCRGFGDPRTVCLAIRDNRKTIGFDQLIYEGTWVHISFSRTQKRDQILTAKFLPGRVEYLQGIV